MNWVGDSKPATNDSVIFDATSTADCSWDLAIVLVKLELAAGYTGIVTINTAPTSVVNPDVTQGTLVVATAVTTWSDNHIHGGTFTINATLTGNWIQLVNGTLNLNANATLSGSSGFIITAGTFTPDGTAILSCAGNVTIRGTLAPDRFILTMIGATPTLDYGVSNYAKAFTFSGTTCSCSNNFYSDAFTNSGTFTIASGKTFSKNDRIGAQVFANTGTVDGAGTLSLNMYNADSTVTFGTISCPMEIYLHASSAAGRTVTLAGNTAFGSTLSILSGAAYTMTLAHGTNYTLGVTGLTTLGAYGVMTQGTGTWTFTGGFTLNDANAVLTQGGNITCTGDCTLTVGTLTPTASYTFTCVADFYDTNVIIIGGALKLAMSTDGKNIYNNSAVSGMDINFVTINGNVGLSSAASRGFITRGGWTIAADKTWTISSSVFTYSSGAITNSGIMAGASTFTLMGLTGGSTNHTFGVMNCPVSIVGWSNISSNKVETLGANTTFGSTLSILSNNASYTMELHHNTNYTLSVTGLTTLGAYGVMTQGTGLWTFTGGLTQSGASSVFTMGGSVTCTGDFLLSAGTFTGVYLMTCAGNFTTTAGTLTSPYIQMTGTAKSITLYVGVGFSGLTISGTTTQAGATFWISNGTNPLLIEATGVLTIASTKTMIYVLQTDGTLYSNLGTIGGTGTLEFDSYGKTNTVTFGIINSPVVIICQSAGALSNATTTLGANTSFGSTLNIYSNHATYTMIISHGTNYTLGVTGLITLGTRGVMMQGTGTWTFNGGITINGTSALYTQGGAVSVIGTTTLTTGTLTGSISYTWTCSDNFVYSAGTITAGVLNLTMSGTTRAVTISTDITGLRDFTVNDDTTINGTGGTCYIQRVITIASGKTLTLTRSIAWRCYTATASLSNAGIINGAATFIIYSYNGSNVTITFGIVNAFIIMQNLGVSASIVSLGANTTFGSQLQLISSDTTSMTLSHGTNYTLTVTDLITMSVRGIMTQGTGTWVFTGGLTQSGASSVFTQGGAVTMTGDMTVSAGTFTGVTTGTLTASGNVTFSGGTLTASVLNLSMAGTAKVLTSAISTSIYNLTFGGTTTVTYTGGGTISCFWIMTISAAISISSGTILLHDSPSGSSVTMNANVGGTGIFQYNVRGGSTPSWGSYILCPCVLSSTYVAGYKQEIHLQGNTTFGSTLTIQGTSDCQPNLTFYSLTPNQTTTVTGLCTIGDYGTITQSTGVYTFTAGLVINGTSALYTMAAGVTGNVTVTSGTMSGGSETGISGTLDVTGTVTPTSTFRVNGLATLGTGGTINGTQTMQYFGGFTQSGAGSSYAGTGTIWSQGGALTISNGTFDGSRTIFISTSFNKTGGTVTYATAMPTFTMYSGTTYASNDRLTLAALNILQSLVAINSNVTTQAFTGSAAVTLNADMQVNTDTGFVFSNAGISGSGSLTINGITSSRTVTFGTVSVPVTLNCDTAQATTITITLGANTVLGSTLTLTSGNATGSIALDDGTNYTLSVTGLTTITKGTIAQGTGAFAFTGGLSIGVGCVFTQIAAVTGGSMTVNGTWTSGALLTINSTGSWDSSVGTFTRSTSTVTLSGTGTLTTAVVTSGDFATLVVSGSITLGSDVYVQNGYYRTGTVIIGSYYIYCYPLITSVGWTDSSIDVNEYSTAYCNTLALPAEATGNPATIVITVNSIDFSLTPDVTYTYWTHRIQGREIAEGSLTTIGTVLATNAYGTDTATMSVLNILTGALTHYSNMLHNAQATIVNVLSTDETIASYTTNILDGIPTSLYRGTGFPYVIVHTPTVNEDRYTQTRVRGMITFTIEIYDKKEGNVRKIADAVKNCLYLEQAQLRERRLTHMTVKNTGISREFLPDESSTPVWKYTINPGFRWVGT